MTIAVPKFGMGASVARLENAAFVTGRGRYTDDVAPPGCLQAVVLRAPVAHAAIRGVDVSAALAAPGVRLVLVGADVAHLGALRSEAMPSQPDGTKAPTRDIPILCADRVRHVGDAVAFVVAETRAQAQDAAERIDVDYDADAVIAETDRALDADASLVWPELGSNLAFTHRIGDAAQTQAAFARAAHVTRVRLRQNRLVSNYLEARSALGEWIAETGRFRLTTGSQGVHGMRRALARQVFKIPEDRLQVVTPDVGGGFGPKAFVYREHALVLEAARRLRAPVKWSGERTEHFLVDAHGRDNAVEAALAVDAEGRFTALRVQIVANLGAYCSAYGPMIPVMGASMATGVYAIPALDLEIKGVYTHTCPVDAYRGAGRPEAAFLIETLVDACARDLGLSRDEIRRRNFIRPNQFPFRTPAGRTYDVGEFAGHMDRAMTAGDWAGFEARRAAARGRGRIRGIGLATYIEACAFAGSEPAFLELHGDGAVSLKIGTQSNGQGHATAYAQLAAQELGLDPAMVRVRQGDSDDLPRGGGTGGSRSIPLGGVSVVRAGQELAAKIKRLAGDELEADPADIELSDGAARIIGTDRMVRLGEIARRAANPDDLRATGVFVQDEATYPNGTHVCEVEIDPETGSTAVVAYTIVDDFGATVNPLLLAGQVHGGVAQGLGQALMEDAVYGEDGQLLAASFMDYAMPRADDLPSIAFETRNVPSTTNALGIKGAGEAGTIGATPAAMSAVRDALGHAFGVWDVAMPATPSRVWEAIRGATGAATR